MFLLRIALADEPVWDPMVTEEDVDHAKVIIDFIIEQKFRLINSTWGMLLLLALEQL